MGAIPILFLILSSSFCAEITQATAQKKGTSEKSNLQNYIVHVRQPEQMTFAQSKDLESWHQSFLPFGTSTETQQRMLYSYKNIISGFSARLTPEEVKAMQRKDGFESAYPERMLHPLTTESPHFLGLQQNSGFWNDSNFGKGVIIGVLDTGILPDHPSFSSEGMPPPPAKWKGRCDFNVSQCNNKLIGARSFNVAANATKGAAEESPVDEDGHGTHTSSTAAGGFVHDADVLGNAQGTAAGMAPLAHVSMYKVCSGDGCPESDILAGLDAAVSDGVDVVSMSIGGDSVPFFKDNIAIGSFAAIQKGVFVSCAAGNSGPFDSTLANEAPWILTVGASNIDRKVVATVKLGNGEELGGESLPPRQNFSSPLLALVYAGTNKSSSALCGPGAFNGTDVNGKIVLCERGGGIGRIAKGVEVKNAGGAGMILMNKEADGFSTIADAHALPASHVSYSAGLKIKAYLNSTTKPMATILFKGTVIGNPLSPAVTSFSSRGPSSASPGILKPDIIGPGVSILAAWPFPIDNKTDSKYNFNMMSGTSMACPHLSGIAALLKSSHPDWSPAAIKSALMTTADIENKDGKPIIDQTQQPADVFAVGAGHVNPSNANNPGLIYDIKPDDYVPYLCGLGYTDGAVGIIAHKSINCSEYPGIPEGQLNYPSLSVTLGPPQTFTRTVTNVGDASSSYSVMITSPPGVEVTVTPPKLAFLKVNQMETYSVMFNRTQDGGKRSEFAQGYMTWKSAKHTVRSPISVRFK